MSPSDWGSLRTDLFPYIALHHLKWSEKNKQRGGEESRMLVPHIPRSPSSLPGQLSTMESHSLDGLPKVRGEGNDPSFQAVPLLLE